MTTPKGDADASKEFPDPAGDFDAGVPATDEEKAAVEEEREHLKRFVRSLTVDDVKGGNWFVKLLTFSLSTYSEKVDWAYFQSKYPGVPVDAVVDQRVKMATRYAAIEGGLSASAYTGAIVATLGTAGGASPLTVPAAVSTIMVDVVYLSQLQLRLAYDVSVLYRVPIDLSDPEDLWKIIRVAFTIKSGEAVREGTLKVVPALVRPLVKKFFAGSTLTAAKSLPVIGRFLLQRNVVKVGIPLVGIPLAVLLNRWSTAVAGRHAKAVFRNEARVKEAGERLIDRSRHPKLLLWVAWLVIVADKKHSDDEAALMRELVRLARDRHMVADDELAKVVEIDPDDVWAQIDAEMDDLDDIVSAAEAVAKIDGSVNKAEAKLLGEIRRRCSSESGA